MTQLIIPPKKTNPDEFIIRPYARLLTMLGEQLIKNQRIALAEIVKNSYDADASWVTISFENFGTNYEVAETSRIVIEDDGLGMTESVIKNQWMNPATPGKKKLKGVNDTTAKLRKIQGEKGIGRFAVLKLGRKITIVTRPKGSDKEWRILFDFSKYDDDFLSEEGMEKELYLDDLKIEIKERVAVSIVPAELQFDKKRKRLPQGTRIEISDLKGDWNEAKIKEVYQDLSRLQSTFEEGVTKSDAKKEEIPEDPNKFECYIYLNGHEQNFRDLYITRLESLLQHQTVFKVENGKFDHEHQLFSFDLNGSLVQLPIKEQKILGNNLFKKYFGKQDDLPEKVGECGSFTFGFYLFDFNAKNDSKYFLTKDDKEIIKTHRIYLYRDGIRVYPYGEGDDDWLRIDALRGTISAGQFLSNDQVVGFVNITQKGNPELKDKTNREGLIDTGKPYSDFISLIQVVLTYLRAEPYAKYLVSNKNKDVVEIHKKQQVREDFKAALIAVKDNKEATALIQTAEKNYQAERQYLVQRAETTEDLAGVGLSVETASHDIQSFMGKAMILIDTIAKKVQFSTDSITNLFTDITTLKGLLSFIEVQLKDIQSLFTSAKQRRHDIRVEDIVYKVQRIYQTILNKQAIEFEIIRIGSPLVAKTTDAVLLQVLLNLFDNAIYWLDAGSISPKRIEIRLDGNAGMLYFSDSGPGIRSEDSGFIFEPFYSGKGEAGRGLGLYIAKQLLERHDYSIELADLKSTQFLSGANFAVSFKKE